jgi:hypothetical protein
LGKSPDGFYFLAKTGSIVQWRFADKASRQFPAPSVISLPAQYEDLTIKSVQSTASGRVLLEYDGEVTDIYEVAQQ